MKKRLLCLMCALVMALSIAPVSMAAGTYNGLVKVNGTWGYYENGVLTGLNALAKNDWGWWYIGSKGTIDYSFTGVAYNEWGQWYVTNGKLNTSFSGTVDYNGASYVISSGRVKTVYTGSVSISGASVDLGNSFNVSLRLDTEGRQIGSAFVVLTYDPQMLTYNGAYSSDSTAQFSGGNGKVNCVCYGIGSGKTSIDYTVNFTAVGVGDTSVAVSTADVVSWDEAEVIPTTGAGNVSISGVMNGFNTIDGKQVYYQNGIKSQTTGLTKISGTWYYLKNGVVTGLNGLAKNSWGWWYINSSGVIDQNFTGVASNQWGKWYVVNGKLNQNINGLQKVSGTWYYFVNGKVTGLNALANNDYGWWYIGSDGCIDQSFTGVASNKWGTWYVVNGKLNQNINGLQKVSGTWYYFVNGKVTGLNALANNDYGWWYIGSDGQIDTGFTGVASNKWGTWYVINGKVNQGVNGLKNVNGVWYQVTNGRAYRV